MREAAMSAADARTIQRTTISNTSCAEVVARARLPGTWALLSIRFLGLPDRLPAGGLLRRGRDDGLLLRERAGLDGASGGGRRLGGSAEGGQGGLRLGPGGGQVPRLAQLVLG